MKKDNFYTFTYAITTQIFINVVGRLMLAEIIAILEMPFVNLKRLFKENKLLKSVIIGIVCFPKTQTDLN